MKRGKIGQIIYEEDENGKIKKSNLEDYMLVGGVWALYGINRKTSENRCLQVGKSINVGNEILYDIACLHLLKARTDGSKKYINQFKEYCNFNYESNQVQEYLYPHIALQWHSLRFIYIHDTSDRKVESKYAKNNSAKYWRNGRPFGVKRRLDLTDKRMQIIGNLFSEGGEIYSEEDLIRIIEEKLGYDNKWAKILINDCVNVGFLFRMDDKLYSR